MWIIRLKSCFGSFELIELFQFLLAIVEVVPRFPRRFFVAEPLDAVQVVLIVISSTK